MITSHPEEKRAPKVTRKTAILHGNTFHYHVTGGGNGGAGGRWRVQKECLQEKNTDKASDTFEHVKKPFTFLTDSVGMN